MLGQTKWAKDKKIDITLKKLHRIYNIIGAGIAESV
jgi:hypothetical protein